MRNPSRARQKAKGKRQKAKGKYRLLKTSPKKLSDRGLLAKK